MSRPVSPLILAGAVLLSALALSACTPSGGSTAAPVPTPTVTVTVTATPEAPTVVPPSAADPLTALEAWSICYAASMPLLDPAFWTPMPYDPSAVSAGAAGTFDVTVGFAPKADQSGAIVPCVVGGTIGAPTLEVNGPIDLG